MSRHCNRALVQYPCEYFLRARTFRAVTDYFQAGFRILSPGLRPTFQLSLTILLLYQTLFVFRVRSQCLPGSRSKSKDRYSGYLAFHFPPTSTGLSPSEAELFRTLRIDGLEKAQVLQLHMLIASSAMNSVCPVSFLLAVTQDISIDFFSYA